MRTTRATVRAKCKSAPRPRPRLGVCAIGDSAEGLGLVGGSLARLLVDVSLMQPAQSIADEKRKCHTQRQVRLEQIKTDQDGLARGFLYRIDQRAADGGFH